MSYQPTNETARILDAAMASVQAVPYQVSARRVFYQLLQDGVLTGKSSYKNFLKQTSVARKRFYNGWAPTTFIDGGREVIESANITDRSKLIETIPYHVNLVGDIYAESDSVPFLLFEAATSDQQFGHFAPWVDRASLRGDPSVPHKWNIAKRIEGLMEQYDKPVNILYFGDHDPKGLEIPDNAYRDIQAWMDGHHALEMEWCGLTIAQAERYGIPPKPEALEVFEWEALPHDAAGELITNHLSWVCDLESIKEIQADNAETTHALRAEITEVLSTIL